MGRRGPPPKPTPFKVLSGSRRINKDEPKLPPADVECPDYLKGNARFEWERLAPGLVKAGLLTIADVTSFAAYCEAFGTWRQYEGLCEEMGPAMGVQAGYRNAADRAAERMLKAGALFGLNASTRSSMKVPAPKEKPDEKKERFFGSNVRK